MTFPPDEYQRRYERVRSLMSDANLDGLLLTVPQNVNYFSGVTSILAGLPGAYGTVRPLLTLLTVEDDPVVLVQFADYGNAKENAWIDDVRCWFDLPFTADTVADVVKEKGLTRARIGMELSREFHLGMPFNDVLTLRETFPDAAFYDAADLIWRLRMVKSEAEINVLKDAASITAKSLVACLKRVDDGLTEREISNLIARSLLENGADKVNYASATAGEGRYHMFCQLPTDRPVKRGEVVWCDVSAIYRDYCSDMSSFVTVGDSSDKQKRLAELARHVHMKSIDALRPGVPAKDVMATVNRFYREAGLAWNFKIGRCGHGIGLELAEQPSLDDNSDVILERGMVIAFEPAILDECGLFGMEEDILVTDEGPEVLATIWPR